jgi:phytoene dehydrogenase-like protein
MREQAGHGILQIVERLDAVVVGAGPNGLVAAIVLARYGLTVRVYEAAARAGGGAKTESLTVPGFRHDSCSAVHPLGAGSPAFGALPLERHGLSWVQPDLPLAHPTEDGDAIVLARAPHETAQMLAGDAGHYLRLVGPFLGRWSELASDLLRPLTLDAPRHIGTSARFGLRALPPASLLARLFASSGGQALIAGLAAHTSAPLHTFGTGGVALLLAVAAHEVGWPIPRGGSQAITDALAAHLRELGGELVTSHPVLSMEELPSARAYLLDLSAPALVRLCDGRLPRGYLAWLRRVPPGPGVFKLDYALTGPVPWRAEACRRAGTLHLGGSLEEIARSLNAVHAGHAPDRPFLIAAQPSLFDPTRAPPGQHVLWVYGHVPFGWKGDATEALESQIERYAPGWRDLILAKSTAGPGDLESRNPNAAGGDISYGLFAGWHAVLRPVPRRVPYAIPEPGLYLCSAATPPGPGVHGMCGLHAARVALRRSFQIRVTAKQVLETLSE